MNQATTPERYAALAKMKRSSFNRAIIFVEDDAQYKVFRKFINESECELIVTYERRKSLLAFNLAQEWKIPGILCIIDSDFSMLKGSPQKEEENDIFRTDTHDMETMMLASEANRSLFIEFGSEEKLKHLGQEPINIILNSSLPIGYLRWVNEKEKLDLDFKDVDFTKFIKKSDLKIDQKKMIEIIIQNSRDAKDRNYDKINSKIEKQTSIDYDPWQVCCGHDLIEVLSIAFRKLFGSKRQDNVKPDRLEEYLRGAYSFEFFKESNLYELLVQWETNNTPYKIFSD